MEDKIEFEYCLTQQIIWTLIWFILKSSNYYARQWQTAVLTNKAFVRKRAFQSRRKETGIIANFTRLNVFKTGLKTVLNPFLIPP